MRLRVADVALFYGERSGGIRTYVNEKAGWAAGTGAVEHHVVVPGPVECHERGRHELRSLRVAASNGYRLPLGVGALKATLREIRPDVVLLHDPFWGRLGVAELARRLGALVVAVHHSSSVLHAAALPGPRRVYCGAFRAWIRHAYASVDALMSVVDTSADAGRAPDLPLRFGLSPAFRPRPDVPRGDHVLYVGRLAREKGVLELLEAASRSAEPWPLLIVGSGPIGDAVVARADRLGLGGRVEYRPFVREPERLAADYAGAACVVMPGAFETFGLVALEAAASGARVVACRSAPSAGVVGALAETFAPGDADGLLAAIERARSTEPDAAGAAVLAERHTWARAFEAELRDLERLLA